MRGRGQRSREEEGDGEGRTQQKSGQGRGGMKSENACLRKGVLPRTKVYCTCCSLCLENLPSANFSLNSFQSSLSKCSRISAFSTVIKYLQRAHSTLAIREVVGIQAGLGPQFSCTHREALLELQPPPPPGSLLSLVELRLKHGCVVTSVPHGPQPTRLLC